MKHHYGDGCSIQTAPLVGNRHLWEAEHAKPICPGCAALPPLVEAARALVDSPAHKSNAWWDRLESAVLAAEAALKGKG
jgi:hypothetical protein